MGDFDFFKAVAIARPGDLIVVRVDDIATEREFNELVQRTSERIPDGIRLLAVRAEEMVLYRPLDRTALEKALAEGYTVQEAIDIVMRKPEGGTDG